MGIIEVSHVTHHYGVKPVLRDVSLSVAQGEIVALMGPNGMGKSTLMGVMAGVLWPIRGFVEIDGHPAGSMACRMSGSCRMLTACWMFLI